MKRGYLVAIEGIDGSGKSSLCQSLRSRLHEAGFDAVILKTRPPEIDALVETLIQTARWANDSLAYMFLFQALHSGKHDLARQALRDGQIVIADRWNFSFFVYHNRFGPLSKLPPETRTLLDELAFRGLTPDLSVLVDLPCETAFARRVQRGDEIVSWPSELKFYRTIEEEYRNLLAPGHALILDGTQPADALLEEVLRHVLPALQCNDLIRDEVFVEPSEILN